MRHFKSVNSFRCLNDGPCRGQMIAHKVYFNNLFITSSNFRFHFHSSQVIENCVSWFWNHYLYLDVQIVSTSENANKQCYSALGQWNNNKTRLYFSESNEDISDNVKNSCIFLKWYQEFFNYIPCHAPCRHSF